MNIIEMAKQAGPLITTPFDQWCENFATLVRNATLDEAAGVCTGIATKPSNVILGVAVACADAIRQLKETK